MMPNKDKIRTLCESCGKSYADIRRHLRGNAHKRKVNQTAMPFATATR